MSCDLYFDSDNVFDCGHHDCDGCCDFHKKDNGSSEMQKVIKIAEINFLPNLPREGFNVSKVLKQILK